MKTNHFAMKYSIPILDLFAGPGGLGEGFSFFKNEAKNPAFRLLLSVEMDPHAHRTLTLRAFVREFIGREKSLQMDYPAFAQGRMTWADLMANHPKEAAAAQEEAMCATMGVPADDARVDARIKELKPQWKNRPCLLIGGPPCQAYSLVGRARNKGIADYDAEQDHRHVLYEQYLRILDQVKPAAFVMENVKGILSAKLASKGGRIFDAICADFRSRGYQLHSLSPHLQDDAFDTALQPDDFLLRSEQHGIPQTRHRVILVGLRKDLVGRIPGFSAGDWRLELSKDAKGKFAEVPVETVLDGLPRIRSGVSGDAKADRDAWQAAILGEIKSRVSERALREELETAAMRLWSGKTLYGRGNGFVAEIPAPIANKKLAGWLEAAWLGGIANHEARGHMPSDLVRYLFCASFAEKYHRSPTLRDFPAALLPDHANAADAASGGGVFADRFRVQACGRPATTVTAHISKDGHYFIHPDPRQCRSLTVREAARLQTFPDDYLFQGPRTEQYRQVGNAVPPFLAHQIAEVLHGLIRTAWPDA